MKTRSRKLLVSLLTGLLVTTVLAACGDDSDDSDASEPGGVTSTSPAVDPTDETCEADAADGSLTVASYSEVRGIDPLFAAGGSTGSIEIAAVYDVLIRYNPDSGDYEPWLAESLTPNDDNTVWTLRLRPGVTFSSGDPLDAAAVKASIERHQSETGRSVMRSLALLISSMEPVDDLTLRLTLSKPWPSFPYLLGGPVGMIANPAAVAAAGDPAAFAANPVGGGAGPYVVRRFAPGEELVLEARPDYWGGPVCVEELRFITSPVAPVESLQSGQIDVAFLRDPKLIKAAEDAGLPSFSTLNGAGEMILVNNGVRGSTPPTTDVRLRRAIAMAIDPAVVDERANDGTGLPTSALIHERSRYYDGVEGPAYDPDAARKLVEEVKAEGTWDGKIRFVCDNTPTRSAIGLAVKTQLEAVGFQVETQGDVGINTVIQAVLTNADFDLACWGINVTDQNPWAKLDRNFNSAGGSNASGYKNPEFDAALDTLRAAETEEETKAALAEIQRIWNDTAPGVVLSASSEVNVFTDRVRGLVPTEEAVILFPKAVVR